MGKKATYTNPIEMVEKEPPGFKWIDGQGWSITGRRGALNPYLERIRATPEGWRNDELDKSVYAARGLLEECLVSRDDFASKGQAQAPRPLQEEPSGRYRH